jgi:murein DD-endopeptidase MepM/ murein hydrolase activator NlpD
MAHFFQRKSLDDILAGAAGRPPRRAYAWDAEQGPKPLWAIAGDGAPYGEETRRAIQLGEAPGGVMLLAQAAAPEEGADAPGAGVLYPENFLPAGKLAWPTDHLLVTSEYGDREIEGTPDFHNGVDLRAPLESPIRAVDDGIVTEVLTNSVGGNQIRILHPDGYVSGYAHTGAVVEPGQKVKRGGVIGYSDGSGGVKPHLHLTYRHGMEKPRVDPYPFLPQAPTKR